MAKNIKELERLYGKELQEYYRRLRDVRITYPEFLAIFTNIYNLLEEAGVSDLKTYSFDLLDELDFTLSYYELKDMVEGLISERYGYKREDVELMIKKFEDYVKEYVLPYESAGETVEYVVGEVAEFDTKDIKVAGEVRKTLTEEQIREKRFYLLRFCEGVAVVFEYISRIDYDKAKETIELMSDLLDKSKEILDKKDYDEILKQFNELKELIEKREDITIIFNAIKVFGDKLRELLRKIKIFKVEFTELERKEFMNIINKLLPYIEDKEYYFKVLRDLIM
ncbi:MAG: hypothetical protein QW727_04495 [Candidatus Pacearchaeota archaeon]